MCGLFAVFQKNLPVDRDRVNTCLEKLSHRGPDHQAIKYFTSEFGGPQAFTLHGALAHSRLSILDLDPRANQPFGDLSEGGLVYNGEIYNFRELRTERQGRAEFNTDCDTELLYRDLLNESGPAFSEYNGMWAYVFWHAASQKVHIGRDRYGQKPLHYYLDDDCFIVSSEVRPILQYLGKTACFNKDLIASFIRHGSAFPFTGHPTLVEPVEPFPPSHIGHFDPVSWTLSTQPFFDPAPMAHDGPEESLTEAFRRAVLARLVSDRPVGLLLSGGIDSTLILSVLASENRLDQVRCFVGDTGTSEDAAYARACAQQLGIDFDDIHLDYTVEAFDRFIDICAHMEKPFQILGNSMALPEMYQAISQTNVRVVLDGTGGDEVFGGYWDRYLPAFASHAERRGHRKWLDKTAKGDHLTADLEQLDARLRGNNKGFQQKAVPYLKEWVAAKDSLDPLATERRTPRKTLLTDAFSGRLNDWVWQNDRNAMTYGLENRSPFLDVGLVPFIGTDYRKKFRGPWNKLELRNLFDDFTPLPTQWRQQKQGFRWQSKEFVDGNKAQLLDLIGSSRVLPHFIELERYLDDLGGGRAPAYALTTRLASLAALENSLPATV